MSFNYTQQADSILIGMNDYLTGFTVYHSDIMYNYYKEKVFTVSYDQILDRISALYKIPRMFFNQDKLNRALTMLHKRYQEYEKFYMEQRDLNADLSKVTMTELDNIALTLERYTACFFVHLNDLKIGFNLFLLVEHHQKYFREHNQYDLSGVVSAPPGSTNKPLLRQSIEQQYLQKQDQKQQQSQTKPQETATDEVTMNITNMDNQPRANLPKVTPQEFMMHLQELRKLANHYFDTHLKPGVLYQLELKLVFPQEHP